MSDASSKNIAIILSGCGVYDGSEIYESVLTMLYIEENGYSFDAFAPDIAQMHVINHATGDEMPESRNVLTESARLTRGEVSNLNTLTPDNYDALIIPGGFGAAKNLSSFATEGESFHVNPDVLKTAQAFKAQQKPIGLMCIAPALACEIFGNGVELTIGDDKGTAAVLEARGATHMDCEVNEAYIDEANKLVTTPAYMLASSILEASTGIELLVKSVIALIEDETDTDSTDCSE